MSGARRLGSPPEVRNRAPPRIRDRGSAVFPRPGGRNDGFGGWSRNPESLLGPYMVVDREAGCDMLGREGFREALYADCADEDVALANALLTPEPRGPLSPTNSPIRTTPENFGRIPRFYIELTQESA